MFGKHYLIISGHSQSPQPGLQKGPMSRRRPILPFPLPPHMFSKEQMIYNALKMDSGKLSIRGEKLTVTSEEELERSFVGNIGNGSYSNVDKYKCKDYEMAVKTFDRSDELEENEKLTIELNFMTKTGDCPNIVEFYGYFISQQSIRICMEIMEISIKELLEKTKPIPESMIGKITVDVVTALNYLKENHNTVHQNIKPSNIFLTKHGVSKISDFGIGPVLDEYRYKHCVREGPFPYLRGPELFESISIHYDFRSDVWSLGVLIVEMAKGRSPFNGDFEFELLTRIIRDPPPILHNSEGFTAELCDFVEKCLQKELELRPSYSELLNHPFITSSRGADTDVGAWLSQILDSD